MEEDNVTRVVTILPASNPPADPARVEGSAENASTTTQGTRTLSGWTAGSLPGAMTLPDASAASGNKVRQVGRYEVRELLGRGGMATVYKAHDPGIDRIIAIKFLHASLCEDEQYIVRFVREAKAAGMLSHPNIATVYDVGEIEGRPYIAMELLEGASIGDRLAEGRTFTLREIVEIGIQLARALDYAHAKGIVHRDIKPANIVLLDDQRTIKVMDFGIAHMESSSTTQHTRVGDVLGTPQYMSPEQTLGQKIDGRSDIFSAGVMLYQLVTGKRPFEGENIVTLMMNIAKNEPPPISASRPDVPASLRRVVERCLAKQPERRFQSGGELAEALIKVAREMDEESRAKDGPRIVSLRVKWTAMMAAIVALVMAATGTVVTQRQQALISAQVIDNGASLARFIATQNAIATLSEDWTAIEVQVQQMMKTGDFKRLAIVDHLGVIRASSDTAQVGEPYKAQAGENLGTRGNSVAVIRSGAGDASELGFEAPITFQDKRIGSVALGIAERPLMEVARLSMMLMALLAVVTVLAVAVATYFVARWFSRPIKLLGESMAEIGRGRLDHRIAETRNDEFGLLYLAFDEMAKALQQRIDPSPAGAAAESGGEVKAAEGRGDGRTTES